MLLPHSDSILSKTCNVCAPYSGQQAINVDPPPLSVPPHPCHGLQEPQQYDLGYASQAMHLVYRNDQTTQLDSSLM